MLTPAYGACSPADSVCFLQLLKPLERLRRLWLRIPRQVLFMHKLESVNVSRAALASVHDSHPLLVFLCFGHAQVRHMVCAVQ